MMEQAHDPDQQLAERYFLGELTDTEAEAYEAHYFDCAGCAEYVREVQILFDSGRDVAYQNVIPAQVVDFNERKRRKVQWMPAAAMLVIAITGPLLAWRLAKQPYVHASRGIEIEFSQSRAEASAVEAVRVGEAFHLSVIAPPEAATGDQAVIRNIDTGKLVSGGKKLTQADLNAPFDLQPSELPVGRYEVVIERADGNRRTRIAAKPFEVRR
jgi:anti-sigma factor RsiW